MARKRKIESDDDSSFEPIKQRRNAVMGRKPAKRQTKSKGAGRKRDASDAEYLPEAEVVESSEIPHTRPHRVSLHVIAHAAPLREALLEWYEGVHASRGMPWRKPFEHSWDAEQKAQRAYEVWVSEIMLQQTQVATVIPYYNKWMEKFPTIRDLAASNIDAVNSIWKGLGYYSRAARLLSGAQKAVQDFKGRLPDNAEAMEKTIPGIGRYSAGAICSIAYNERVPVLDGNVHRLLSRILALHAPPKAKQTLDVLWAGAAVLVKDADRPGDLNQALIELGSTVCKVRDPSCDTCPLQRACGAYAAASKRLQHLRGNANGSEDEPVCKDTQYGGTSASSSADLAPLPDIEEFCKLCEPLPDGSLVTAYPMKVEKKKAREELDIVNVIEWRKGATATAQERWFLLVRRPGGGLLAGLQEFPTSSNVPVTTPPSAQTKIADKLLSALLVSPPPRSSRPPHGSDRESEEERGRQSQAYRRSRPKPKLTAAGSNVATSKGAESGPRVVKIVPAGDVLHIFSHIRKTYRVQWVVLEGGSSDEPPPLVPEPELAGPAFPKTSKGRSSRKNRTIATSPPQPQPQGPGASPNGLPPPSGQTTQWVLLDAVADANIGTGVLKIWRQVRALWEASVGGTDDDS
ncbi:DNA glycosylase [Dichomitus squalens]|nr:DNA glycosylase [Dichomitus squalens]